MSGRFDLTAEQWRIGGLVNSFLMKKGTIPVFVGYFAKCAIEGVVRGVSKDVDLFVFDEITQTSKDSIEQLELAEYLYEEFQKLSIPINYRLNHYVVLVTIPTPSGDVDIELLFPAEGIDPDVDQLNRSYVFNGLRVISPEDWIVMKLEAIRDRTAKKARKHKNDLIEIASFYLRGCSKISSLLI